MEIHSGDGILFLERVQKKQERLFLSQIRVEPEGLIVSLPLVLRTKGITTAFRRLAELLRNHSAVIALPTKGIAKGTVAGRFKSWFSA